GELFRKGPPGADRRQFVSREWCGGHKGRVGNRVAGSNREVQRRTNRRDEPADRSHQVLRPDEQADDGYAGRHGYEQAGQCARLGRSAAIAINRPRQPATVPTPETADPIKGQAIRLSQFACPSGCSERSAAVGAASHRLPRRRRRARRLPLQRPRISLRELPTTPYYGTSTHKVLELFDVSALSVSRSS